MNFIKLILKLSEKIKSFILIYLNTPSDAIKHPAQCLMSFVGACIYFLFKPMRPKRVVPPKIQSILIVRRNKLGDAIVTVLALKALQIANPETKLTIITDAYASPVFKTFLPDAVVIEPPSKYLRHFYFTGFHPSIKNHYQKDFDVGINCSGSFSSKAIYMLNMFNCKWRIAVGGQKKYFWYLWLDDHAMLPLELGKEHQMIKILSILRRTTLAVDLPFVPEMSSVKSDGQRFLFFPESNRKESIWGLHNWIELKSKTEREGSFVAVCGSSKLKDAFPEVISPDGTQALIDLVRQFDHVVCSEGGASHLAALCQKRITVLSGMSIANTWFPWSRDCLLIERTKSIRSVSVDDVLDVSLRRGDFEKISTSFDASVKTDAGQINLM